MRYRDCMIAWCPKRRIVRVGPHPEVNAWTREPIRYPMSVGGCVLASKKWSRMRCATEVMMDFNTLVVRDGLDPMAVHDAFLVIDEYRFHISPNCPGAEQWSDDYTDDVERERAWRLEDDYDGISI